MGFKTALFLFILANCGYSSRLTGKIVIGNPDADGLTLHDVYAERGLVGAKLHRLSWSLSRGMIRSIICYQDLNNNSRIDLDLFEPSGWYNGQGEMTGPKPVQASAGGVTGLDVHLWSFAPLPQQAKTEFGSIRRLKGLPLLSLRGSAAERGYAHGLLLGRQIVDFFRFFTLEATCTSVKEYTQQILPYLDKQCAHPAEYTAEIDAIIAGIGASGASLYVPELQRDLSRLDLVYLNDYGNWPQFRVRAQVKTNPVFLAAADGTRVPLVVSGSGFGSRSGQEAGAGSGSAQCTQFAFWGESTQGTDVKGGTIVGRNMDAEIDFRKITVAHFLMIAVQPAVGRKYVHFMWPGFVGTSSGLNDAGVHVMANSGQSNPKGGEASGVVSGPWVQREILAGAGSLKDVPAIIDRFLSDKGGMCGAGCNLMLAEPHRNGTSSAMVYEGDRFGAVYRAPGVVEPYSQTAIMVSNHFGVYGYDPVHPTWNFGQPFSVSSLQRYMSGKHTIDAWAANNHKIGTAEVVRLLQTAAESETEHSVITRPNLMTLDVAVADMRFGGWHAPYLKWTSFEFKEFFVG